MEKLVERLKFYADTPNGDKNKFFCFKIPSIIEIDKRLLYFMKKNWYIRSAWYECIEDGKVKNNWQIDLVTFCSDNEQTVIFIKD
jgi:hypothetical protein